MTKHHDLVDVSVILKHETDKAWLFSDGTKDVWIPKSQCEFDGRQTVTMPEWLATDKGLV